MLLVLVFAGVVSNCDGSAGLRRHDSLSKGDDSQALLQTSLSSDAGDRLQTRAAPTVSRVEEEAEHAKEDAVKTLQIASNFNPYRMLKADIISVREYMMPGTQPHYSRKDSSLETICLLIGLLWFYAYARFFYQSDREESLDRWADVSIAPRDDGLDTPDLVLVFHKPNHPYADKYEPVKKGALRNVLLPQLKKDESAKKGATTPKVTFTRTKSLLKDCATKGSIENVLQRATLKFSPEEKEGEAAGHEDHHISTFGEVREALLQDVYEHLPEEGFHVTVFSSVDDDELFVCVTLKAEAEEKFKSLLQAQGARLQLQQTIVKTLGIGQDPTEQESSPPFVRYQSGLSATVLGKGKTDVDLFKMFVSPTSKVASSKAAVGTVICGVTRIGIIYTCLKSFMNLAHAEKTHMLVKWFPVHFPHRVAQLQSSWARWSLLTDLSFVQPVTTLHTYFGSRIAFMFAWNGMYCKMLLALMPVALLFEILNVATTTSTKLFEVSNHTALGFSIIVVIWGKLVVNLWCREEEYLIELWDMKNEMDDRSTRIDFNGTFEDSHIDDHLQEMYYPQWKYQLRISTSWLATLAFCALNIVVVVSWINVFDGQPTRFTSIGQAVIIQVFTQVFQAMVQKITVRENHKYQKDFYESFLMKTFIFQFVNQYCPWFYIGVKQQFTTHGCTLTGDCVGMLKAQLPVTLMCLVMMRIVLVIVAAVKVKVALWLERRQMVAAGLPPPVYSFVEEQSKYSKFGIRDQVEAMSCLAQTLGYVLIFGAAVPRVIPLCFFVFVVQLRGLAVQLTTSTTRSVPRLSVGIGAWKGIVHILLIVGMAFTGYLLVQFGPSFRGTSVLTRLFCLCLYIMTSVLIWACVDLVLPNHCPKTDILAARREYVTKKLLQRNENHKTDLQGLENSASVRLAGVAASVGQVGCFPRLGNGQPLLHHLPSDETPYLKEVKSADWGKIPKANPVPAATESA